MVNQPRFVIYDGRNLDLQQRHQQCTRFQLFAFLATATTFLLVLLDSAVPKNARVHNAVFLLLDDDNSSAFSISEMQHIPDDMARNINPAVDPCDNFYEFVCGKWINETEIPADKGEISISFDSVAAKVEEDLEALFSVDHAEPAFRKLHEWYLSCTNLSQIEARGALPLKPYLDKIDSIVTKEDLDAALIFLMKWKIHPLLGLGVERGIRNSTINVLNLKTPDLFLPQDSYTGWPVPGPDWWTADGLDLFDFDRMQNATDMMSRRKAANYFKKICVLAGYSEEEAKRTAARSLWSDTELALWVQQENVRAAAEPDPRGPIPVDLAALESRYAAVPWRGFLEGFRAECQSWNTSCAETTLQGRPNLVVNAPLFLSRLAAALASRPPRQWIPFLRTRAIHALMPLLSSDFYTASLDLVTEVEGIPELPPRGKVCVGAVSRGLPGPAERLYARERFPAAARARGEEMLRYIKDAFVEGMRGVGWMDAQTDAAAVRKARAMAMHLGAPARRFGLDYPVRPDGYFENAQHAALLNMLEGMRLLDEPVARDRWPLLGTTANAMYSVKENAAFIPAAVMQPPFFSADYAMERNFGGIGAIIGHEMTHGFDATGRRYDADGAYAGWWDPAAEAAFLNRTACVERLLDGFAFAGVRLRGAQFAREAVADGGGAQVALRAYRAWHRSARGRDPPPAGERLLLVAFGQLWCEKGRYKQEQVLARTEAHPPGVFRCNGVASQSAAFAAAFACPAGAPMNPGHRCTVW